MQKYNKYAQTVLTEEQLDELQERYFKYGCYGRDEQTLLIDGSIDPITILAAADYIRSLDTSLRPQNTWKPSDEQMESLKGIINSLPHQEVLYSLYQDLKNLKG